MSANYELLNPSGGLPNSGDLRLVNPQQSALRRFIGVITRWRRRRNATRELQALSDHHLTDIGLDRSQIVPAVKKMMETEDQTVARVARRKQWRA